MADSTYAVNSFLGGEISPDAQGRFDLPTYHISMNVCLNSLPMETGAWTRRGGTFHCGTTRGGVTGRLIPFDFLQTSPYNIEFTDSHLQFWNGTALATTNDDATVSSISSANPAKVATSTAHGWSTYDRVFFKNLGSNNRPLQGRRFSITKTSSTEFTLQDEVTGANIDGSTLGSFVSGTVARVLDLSSPYSGGAWANVRLIPVSLQGANGSVIDGVILHSSVAPQVLQVTTAPTSSTYASFSLSAATFTDGPYLDPVPGGALATPSATQGIVNLTLSFAAYSSTQVYKVGDYVSYSSNNYKSLVDANINNQPDVSPSYWTAVASTDPIGANGFVGTDIGRHIRFYSEPALWVTGTSYVAGNVVSYVDTSGNTAYYTCLSNHTAGATNAPGVSASTWAVNGAGAIWTWGKITGLLSEISRTLSGAVHIGDMSQNGGLNAAYDGVTNQAASASATASPGGVAAVVGSYIGQNYTGASGGGQRIYSATLFPSSDYGIMRIFFGTASLQYVTVNLRGKASAPSSRSDGTLLGTYTTNGLATVNPTTPINILSNDTSTSWGYVWFEIILNLFNPSGETIQTYAAECKFFNPPGTGTSNGCVAEILGPALLYTTPIRTWRLGLFSGTTGWPTCGTFHEGRLWLSGIVGNRVDASVSGSPFTFSPTQSNGTVTSANAISYTFNSPDINPIYWMVPDQQGIICGTKAGEWLIQASNLNSPLTPTSMQAHRVTRIGCANVEPRRGEHTLLFVQRYQHKVMEYFADVFSGKFSAPNLSADARHLTYYDISEIAYQQELVPTLWARDGSGSLFGCTYKRENLSSAQGPTFAAWHRHTLGSGRVVESICVGPSNDGTLDALSFISNDSGTAVRHVELMTDFYPTTTAGQANILGWSRYVDDFIYPSSISVGTNSCTLYGLWNHNGKTLTVWGNGVDLGDYAVSSGALTIPFSTAFTSTVANALTTANTACGFTFTSQGQIVRPQAPPDAGTRNGPALAKVRRIDMLGALLVNTQGLSIGTRFSKLNTANFQTDGGTAYTASQLFSGVFRQTIKDTDSFDGMLAWQVTRPYPATIAALQAFLDTKDT